MLLQNKINGCLETMETVWNWNKSIEVCDDMIKTLNKWEKVDKKTNPDFTPGKYDEYIDEFKCLKKEAKKSRNKYVLNRVLPTFNN